MSRRKAEMVLELVDRATRPARRFMALQRRMGAAVERANRMARRSSQAAQRATDLYRRAVQGLARAQDAMQRGIRRSNDLIRRQVTQMRMATGLMRGGVMGMGRAALLAGGMMTAYAGTVGLAANAMLGPARQFEKFQTILTTTEGSAEAARKAMGWVQDFAVNTPFELDQVMQAFVQLRAYGLDPTNGLLRTLGDTSAAMGKDVIQAVEAIADAVTGENERLKEFGIKASKVKGFYEYRYSVDGVEKIARARADDRAGIEVTLVDILNERFGGAMELQKETFDGMLSNIMDQWAKFQLMIMGSGVFDWMKSKLKLVLDTLDKMAASGELEIWAKTIAGHIITGLEAIWAFGKATVQLWKTVHPWLQSAADALGGWRNLALAVLAIPLRGVILGAAFSLLQFAAGAAVAMKALAGIGFGSALTGVLGFGNALMSLANPLNWVKGAFIALRVALLSTGIGALAVGLAMAGVWIYNNWSGLKAFFKGFGEAFMKALGPARPLAERVIRTVRRLWDWIGRLTAPLDAGAEQWAEWGRAAGRFVGDAVDSVRRFVTRIGTWFANLAAIDWDHLLSREGLAQAWNAITQWISERAARLWDGVKALDWGDYLNPLNWGDYLSRLIWGDYVTPLKWDDNVNEIDWLALAGGVFLLSTLIRPIVWTARLVGAPIRWAFLLGRFALRTLVKPIVWTAKLLGGPIAWAALLGGKFALKGLVKAITWGAKQIPKVPWRRLAGGGKRFALKGLVTAIKWGSRLIPGIGWALLAGELLWHLLVKPLGWDEYLNLETLRKLWTDSTTWLGEQLAGSWQQMQSDWDRLVASWEKLPGIDWAELFNLEQMRNDWERVASGFKRAAKDIWDKLPDVDWEALIDRQTLTGTWDDLTGWVSQVAGGLWDMLPRIDWGELINLDALKNAWASVEVWFSGKKAPAAGPAGPASLPAMPGVSYDRSQASPGFSNMFPGVNIDGVQERAGGGSFNPGWLLTGERGPELEYRTRGGFIAHNRALRSMLAMSQAAARTAANSNRPQRLLRRAALAGSIAAATAVPAAALDLEPDTSHENRAAIGARYLNERNSARAAPAGTGSITINVGDIVINGSADRQDMRDLRDDITDALLEKVLDALEDGRRSARRREHD